MASSIVPIEDSSVKIDDIKLSAFGFETFDLPPDTQHLVEVPHSSAAIIPLALRWSAGGTARDSLNDVIGRIKDLQNRSGIFTKHLSHHGALLFRDFPLNNADDFSKFAHAFGYKPHEIIGAVAHRPSLAANVGPANDAPNDVLIYNHNESPRFPHSPAYVFFYCQKAAQKGGETSISSSLELVYRVEQAMPDFIHDLSQKGVLSTITYKFDPQFVGGTTLRQAFGKEIKDTDDEVTRWAKIEAQIARYGRGKHTSWEWTDDGLVVTHRIPAIRTQPYTGLPTLFTGLAAYYKSAQNSSDSKRSVTQLYGDGSPIPQKYLAHLAKITDDIRVLHRWQPGDVLVFDNIIAQHGREPWEGEQSDRVVLVSLFDGDTVAGAYGSEEWAQMVQALDG
jgi:alpha-ketoglutarate-dependent taurine dioxygenase